MTPTLPYRPCTLFVVIALSLAACSSKEPATPRGVQLDPNRVRAPAPVAEEETEPEPETRAPKRKLKSPFEELGPGDLMAEPGAVPPKVAAEPDAGADRRELGQELADLLRQTSCLDLAVAAQKPQGRQTISGTAYVMASGRITRATVSASGQPATALRCVESRLVAQGLRGPVPGGAQSVSGSTTIEVVAEALPPRQPAPTAAAQEPAPQQGPYGNTAPANMPPAPREVASPTSDDLSKRPDEIAGAP